ncbi:MAG: DUF4157 domain-containing protein [Piscinibacter sp.]|nr:DUF4157 domain-containing protein [Piscinibacter sp.]
MKVLQRRRRTATRPPRAARTADAASPELAEQNRVRVAQALGAPVQARLKLGAPDDAHEHEADRFADGVVQRQCADCARQEDDETLQRRAEPGAAGAGGGEVAAGTAAAIQGQRGAGTPLPAAERSFFEARLQTPLAPVRLHTDPASAQLAESLGARAFTVGHDVFFGAGEYRPANPDGRHLLAHELAHVRQQSGATLRRQADTETPPAATPPAPEVLPVVDRTTFERRVSDGIALLGGRFVGGGTLAGELQPILQALTEAAAWSDEHGRERGGRMLRRRVGGVMLSLRMVFDDTAAPTRDAMFQSRGADEGLFRIFVRRAETPDDVAANLYHEALHLVTWLSNRERPAAFESRAAVEVTRTLDLSRHSAGITTVQRWLQRLADGVNARRASGDTIPAARLERMARWLVEEVAVRAETEVFAQLRERETGSVSSGLDRTLDGAPMEVNDRTVMQYVFEYSEVFRLADRAALDGLDREALAMLTRILGGLYRTMVRRRFSPMAAPMRPERPHVDIGPMLPGHRSFLPLPEE